MNRAIFVIIILILLIFVFVVILVGFVFLRRNRNGNNNGSQPIISQPPDLVYGVNDQTQFSNNYQRQYWIEIHGQIYILYFTPGNVNGKYLLQSNTSQVYSGDILITDNIVTLNIPSKIYDLDSPDGRQINTNIASLINVFELNGNRADVLKTGSQYSRLTLDDSFNFIQYS